AQLVEERQPDLFDQRLSAGSDLHADDDRQQIAFAQPREDAGFEQRRLAEAGLAEEDGDLLIEDAAQELGGFGRAAAEELVRRFVVRRQPGPGVVAIEASLVQEVTQILRAAHCASSRRIARISVISV